MPSASAIALRAVTKTYGSGDLAVDVLRSIDLTIGPGELVAIMGPSGSGKSTLLNIIGLLDRPSQGEVTLVGHTTASLSERERTRMRGETLGFIFQFHHLLPSLTAAENVAMPLAVRVGRVHRESLRRAQRALDRLSIGDLADRRPHEMSGGQRQRVAVARALVAEPRIVLADEPTGNLDTESSDQVMGELRRLNAEFGMTTVIVTHDESIAARCGRDIRLVDGVVVHDRVHPVAAGEQANQTAQGAPVEG